MDTLKSLLKQVVDLRIQMPSAFADPDRETALVKDSAGILFCFVLRLWAAALLQFITLLGMLNSCLGEFGICVRVCVCVCCREGRKGKKEEGEGCA